MTLPRTLEPEAMDSPDEAREYDAMDHAEVNRKFVADLLDAGFRAEEGEALDVGTGTALIPIELCRQAPTAKALAVDLAACMLTAAKTNVERAGFAAQIRLRQVDAKGLPFDDASFACVISNSIVHHIPEPRAALAEAWRVLKPGGLIFYRDLFRPNDEETVARLVELYTADATERQKAMLADSLRASLRIEEMQVIVASLGGDPNSVAATSDRHWTWSQRKPF